MCKKNKNQQVVVAKAATKYSLNVSKTEMYVGNSFKLKLKGLKGKVKWTSEDDGKDNRGVKIGSTKEEFLLAYGYCESYDDVSSYDSYREYFNNSAYPRTKTNLWWKDGTTQKVCFFILKDFIYSLYIRQK